jgi:hypothetical protein
MAGLASLLATTTMKVVERENLDRETYFALIADGLQRQGYVTEELLASPNVNEWEHDLADELIYLGACCPVGTVLERRATSSPCAPSGDRGLRRRSLVGPRIGIAGDRLHRLDCHLDLID